MVSRSYAWLDESAEHTDSDCARAAALAQKWSALMTAEENRRFAREIDEEVGREPQDCECEACLCEDFENCETLAARRDRQAERDLEIELIEDKLAAIGARMMRPYEHWNEDERYMEYMENRGY